MSIPAEHNITGRDRHHQGPPDPSVSDPTPTLLGSGSFATVWCVRGNDIAFKEVHHSSNDDVLLQEYLTLEHLFLTCHYDTFFMIPRAYAFQNPSDSGSFRETLPRSPNPPASTQRRVRPAPPLVSPHCFDSFKRSTYAMQRIHALPMVVATAVRTAFFPVAQNHVYPILCRLYLGRASDTRLRGSFDSIDPPLYADRYTQLYASFAPKLLGNVGLRPLDIVAEAMGEMLGRLHLRGGCDARGVKFVLGGNGGGGCTFFTIDFNQTRPWDRTADDIPALVDAFFSNDPYYPRPRPADPLYLSFRRAYLQQCPGDLASLGEEFLAQVEAVQARRDTISAPQ